MAPGKLSPAGRVDAEAAAWAARRDAGGWSEADEAALEVWLDRSPQHRIAWLRISAAWARADRLRAMAPSDAIRARRSSARRRERARRVWAGAAAMAAAAATLVVLALPPGGRGSEFSTPVGGHKVVVLSDGSRIELNTASRIEVRYGRTKRWLHLAAGEVYFEMKRDPGRPVEVLAGDRRVTMLGTKFSVRRDADQVVVIVTEGKVRVEGQGGAGGQPPAVVSPNEMLAARAGAAMVIRAPRERIADEMSWRRGRLVFHETSLADAAAEFNRYNQTQIMVAPDVAGTRIGGSFEARNAAAFADLLHTGFGYVVRSDEGRIIISD